MYVDVVQYNSYHNLRPASVEITGFPDYYNSLGVICGSLNLLQLGLGLGIFVSENLKSNVIYRWCLNACDQYTATLNKIIP